MATKKKAAAPPKPPTAKKRPPARGVVMRAPVNNAAGTDNDKRAEIAALMAKINKEQKANVIRFAGDVTNPYFWRRPCGIAELDYHTGGGMPAGTLVTISGPDNVGKSMLYYLYFGMNQRLHGANSAIAYASTEGGIDYKFARMCGWMIPWPDSAIDEENSLRVERGVPELTRDQVIDLKREVGSNVILDGLTGEDLMNNAVDFIRSNYFQWVVIDSLEGVMPADEVDKDLDQHLQQGGRATLLTRFGTKISPILRGVLGENRTTVGFTCQVRANRRKATAPAHIAKYLPDYESNPPYKIRHDRAVDLILDKGEKIKRDKGKGREQIGKVLKWATGKGKAGTRDGLQGAVDFAYSGLFDLQRSILELGMSTGIIKEVNGAIIMQRTNGARFLHYEHGAEEFCDALYCDFDLEVDVRHELMAQLDKSCRYR